MIFQRKNQIRNGLLHCFKWPDCRPLVMRSGKRTGVKYKWANQIGGLNTKNRLARSNHFRCDKCLMGLAPGYRAWAHVGKWLGLSPKGLQS